MPARLPNPECRYGYTHNQLEQILSAGDALDRFYDWCNTESTVNKVLCDGKSYNYHTKSYKPSGCGPHREVIPQEALLKYLGK